MTSDSGDPIDQPGFYPNLRREPNPERIKRIEELADKYHCLKRDMEAARDRLSIEVREAKSAGHSYNQLATAAGVAIGTIQRMVEGRWR